MKDIFAKSFIVPFYKAYLGFFVLVFIIFGVLIDSAQHIFLAKQVLQNTSALTSLITGFLLFSFFQLRFHIKLLNEPKYRVFHPMPFIGPKNFCRNQAYVWAANHFVILIYTVFLSIQSFHWRVWEAIILIWGVLFILLFAHIALLYDKLKRPYPEKRALARKKGKKSAKISYPFWFLVHLKENKPFLLLSCKLLALLLLNLFFYSFYTGDYDQRWLQFGILCTTFINFPVWLEKKDFEQQKLAGFLNLPIAISQKVKFHSYGVLQILAIELLLIFFQYFNLKDIGTCISLLVFIFVLNLGIYGGINLTKEYTNLTRNAIIAFFTLFILILFSTPGIIISIISFAVFLKSVHSPYRN